MCSVFAVAALGQRSPAAVTFTLDFPGSNPGHYVVVVGDDGHGSYKSDGRIDEKSDAVSEQIEEFTVSENIRTEIFDLAKRAHYFSGKIDSGKKNIANTGAKSLAYKDSTHDSKATFNYSGLQPVEQLTVLFQGLSTTLEYGRRLAYFHKYEKLALDDELKKMKSCKGATTFPMCRSSRPS